MYPVGIISPPIIFPIYCLTKSAQFSNLLSLVHWDFMPGAHFEALSSYPSAMLWLLERQLTLLRQLLIPASQSWEEQMHNSMLFSTCFKAIRCFLHNELSSRTHTTGLNLFFQPPPSLDGGLQFWCLKHFFPLAPQRQMQQLSRRDLSWLSAFARQDIHVLSFTFILWIVENHWPTKTCVETNDCWFLCFFFQNLPQPLASLCRIWTNSSRQVVLNCCCQGHLLFSFYLELGVSCDCNFVPIF